MLAIGVLVPLEYGRTGRSWRHAEALQALARWAADGVGALTHVDAGRTQIDNLEDTTALEQYWEKFRIRPEEWHEQELDGAGDHIGTQAPTIGYRKSRSMSVATTFLPSYHALMPHHPALTLLESTELFGPLLFPLYRAALLRKRILIVADTPVQPSCNLGRRASICGFFGLTNDSV